MPRPLRSRLAIPQPGGAGALCARPMARLIQDTIRRALADELLFGRLANGGHVTVDIDDKDEIQLLFDTKEESGATAATV